jgi:hemerythrin-like metal-binding protein
MIDEEHKKFIDIINKATYVQQYDDSPRAISEVLVEMTAYALEHFNTEETYMINFKYYDYKSHKDEHNNFSKIISNYCIKLMDGEFEIIDEILEYLKQWLVNHIQVTDKKYVVCFNGNGLK